MKVQGTALPWSKYLRPCSTVKRRVWSMPGAHLARPPFHAVAHPGFVDIAVICEDRNKQKDQFVRAVLNFTQGSKHE